MINLQVQLALYGMIPLTLLFFSLFPARRAVIVSFLVAWLFLPIASITFPGVPDLTKTTATVAGVMLAILIFDTGRLLTLRPSIWDLPMVLFCLSLPASSVATGYGWYDAASALLSQLMNWGFPYLIGRAYFRDRQAIKELVMAIVLGGLVYVPLCLYEIRMSPQLHAAVYGFYQHSFSQTMRYGGFRPMVFMQTSLAVADWMMAASLAAFWMWRNGWWRRAHIVSAGWLVGALVLTTILCKTFGAALLMLTGFAALILTRWLKSPVVLAILVLVAPSYIALRTTGMISGESMVAAVSRVSHKRGQSLETRIRNEDMLSAKALRKPWFGWGRWGKARIKDKYGKDISITDGLWVIILGNSGLFGLVTLLLTQMAAPLLVIKRYRGMAWRSPVIAGELVLATILILYMIDCVPNAMLNPIFVLGAGALVSTETLLQRQTGQAKVRQLPQRGAAPRGPTSRPQPRPRPQTSAV